MTMTVMVTVFFSILLLLVFLNLILGGFFLISEFANSFFSVINLGWPLNATSLLQRPGDDGIPKKKKIDSSKVTQTCFYMIVVLVVFVFVVVMVVVVVLL